MNSGAQSYSTEHQGSSPRQLDSQTALFLRSPTFPFHIESLIKQDFIKVWLVINIKIIFFMFESDWLLSHFVAQDDLEFWIHRTLLLRWQNHKCGHCAWLQRWFLSLKHKALVCIALTWRCFVSSLLFDLEKTEWWPGLCSIEFLSFLSIYESNKVKEVKYTNIHQQGLK